MIIRSKAANETVAEIMTNHSMTLDEAIQLVGTIYPEKEYDNVEIGGIFYDYDDLEEVY